MKPSEKLVLQHNSLRSQITSLSKLPTEGGSLSMGPQLRRKLLEFFQSLEDHLKLEDEILYPALKNSARSEVRDLAEKFSAEMGGMKDEMTFTAERWTAEGTIVASPDEFVAEMSLLKDALFTRMRREDEELFPLLG